MNLARQGVPTLVACTEPFEPLARALVSAAAGAGELPVTLFVLPHPLLSRTAGEVVALVEERAAELDAWASSVEGAAESAGEEGT